MAIADDHEDNGDHEQRRKGNAQRQEDRHVRYISFNEYHNWIRKIEKITISLDIQRGHPKPFEGKVREGIKYKWCSGKSAAVDHPSRISNKETRGEGGEMEAKYRGLDGEIGRRW